MRKTTRSPLKAVLDVELARAGLTQSDLANRLKVPSTTLSDWVRGAHPPPGDLESRIEKVLGLSLGGLAESAGGGGRPVRSARMVRAPRPQQLELEFDVDGGEGRDSHAR